MPGDSGGLLARLSLGVCGGLVLAVFGLIAASSVFSIETLQVGSSSGKTLFFAIWLLSIAVGLFQRHLFRGLGAYCLTAGALAGIAALSTVWSIWTHPAPVRSDAVTVFNLVLLGLGAALWLIGVVAFRRSAGESP